MQTDGKFESKYSCNQSFFSTIGPKQAWLLDVLAADGNVKNNAIFSIAQSGDSGLLLIQHIKTLLSYSGVVCSYQTSRQNTHNLTITNRTLVAELAQFGIIPRKSLIYTFPKAIPLNVEPEFIRGYFDGDGSVGVYKNGGQLRSSIVGTEMFIDACARKIPITGSKSQHSSKRVHVLEWSTIASKKLFAWMYRDQSLFKGRKFLIFSEFNRDTNRELWMRRRDAVTALIKTGRSIKDAAEIIGVPVGTAYHWR